MAPISAHRLPATNRITRCISHFLTSQPYLWFYSNCIEAFLINYVLMAIKVNYIFNIYYEDINRVEVANTAVRLHSSSTRHITRRCTQSRPAGRHLNLYSTCLYYIYQYYIHNKVYKKINKLNTNTSSRLASLRWKSRLRNMVPLVLCLWRIQLTTRSRRLYKLANICDIWHDRIWNESAAGATHNLKLYKNQSK